MVRLLELEVLRGPHLVLADLGGDEDVSRQRLACGRRVISYSRWMAYCGLMIDPGCMSWVNFRLSLARHTSIWRHHVVSAWLSVGRRVRVPGRQQRRQPSAGNRR
jgi:hypothetical protein